MAVLDEIGVAEGTLVLEAWNKLDLLGGQVDFMCDQTTNCLRRL